jgi:hypothetical protein
MVALGYQMVALGCRRAGGLVYLNGEDLAGVAQPDLDALA